MKSFKKFQTFFSSREHMHKVKRKVENAGKSVNPLTLQFCHSSANLCFYPVGVVVVWFWVLTQPSHE